MPNHTSRKKVRRSLLIQQGVLTKYLLLNLCDLIALRLRSHLVIIVECEPWVTMTCPGLLGKSEKAVPLLYLVLITFENLHIYAIKIKNYYKFVFFRNQIFVGFLWPIVKNMLSTATVVFSSTLPKNL